MGFSLRRFFVALSAALGLLAAWVGYRFESQRERAIIIAVTGAGSDGKAPGRVTKQRDGVITLSNQDNDVRFTLTESNGFAARLYPAGDLTDQVAGYICPPILRCPDDAAPALAHIDDLVKSLAELKLLTSLDIHSEVLLDRHVATLATLPRLRELTLGLSDLSDVALWHIAKMRQLTALEINSGQITDAGVGYLSQQRSLETLKLGSCRVTGSGLRDIELLEDLQVVGGGLTPMGFWSIAQCKRLKYLTIYHGRISDADARHLASSRSLTSLALFSVTILNSAVRELCHSKTIKSLHLCEPCELTSDGLADLWKLPLDELIIEHQRLDGGGISHLTKLKRLHRLSLHSIELSGTDVVALSSMNWLDNLWLTRISLGAEEASFLKSSLPNTTVEIATR